MLVLTLLLALQQGVASTRATAQDSAYVRRVLVQAMHQAEGGRNGELARRLVDQLTTWHMYDAARRTALAADTAWGPEEARWYFLTGNTLAEQWRAGDTAMVATFINMLQAPHQERVRASLAQRLAFTDTLVARRMSYALRRPLDRARVRVNIAEFESSWVQDTNRLRVPLQQAVDSIRSDTTRAARSQAFDWLYRLRRLGGDVSIEQLVDEMSTMVWSRSGALMAVAQQLRNTGEPQAATRQIDSAIANTQWRSNRMDMLDRAYLLRLRRTGDDTVHARALFDSAQQLSPPLPASGEPTNAELDQQRRRFLQRDSTIRERERQLRATLSVIQRQIRSGEQSQARATVLSQLPHIDARWRCDGACVLDMRSGPVGMSNKLIGDYVVAALQLDLRADVVAWAERQKTAEGRASACLAIAEGMSELKLGKYRAYPIY